MGRQLTELIREQIALFLFNKHMLYIYPAYFLSEQTSVMNGGQVSVVDFDELVQILRLLYLVLKF